MDSIMPLNEPMVIVNAASGRVLDADLGTIGDDGTRVQLYGKSAVNQEQRHWLIVSAGADRYHIVNVKSKRFLDADMATIDHEGTTVQLFGNEVPAGLNRQWRFVHAEEGALYIINAQSNRLLDADSATLAKDGTKVQLYGTEGNLMRNRQWHVFPVSSPNPLQPIFSSFQFAPKTFDLLIVAPYSFREEFADFQAFKRANGIESHLILLGDSKSKNKGILGEFEGADHPERIKRAIEYAYRTHSARYVMLVGDASIFPARLRYTKEQGAGGSGGFAGWHDGTYNPSDLYYANLYNNFQDIPRFETWDENKDNKYNEQEWDVDGVTYNPDRVGGYPNIAVGRVPAHDISELHLYLNKVIAYESSSARMPGAKVFAFVADKNYNPPPADELSDQIKASLPPLVASSTPSALFNANPGDPLRPNWTIGDTTTFDQFLRTAWWISYCGHGNSKEWSIPAAGFTDIQSAGNGTNFPIVFAAACETGRYYSNPPIGEYQDSLERFRHFWYHKDDVPTPNYPIDELDTAGNVIRYLNKPLTVPTPSPYSLATASVLDKNRTLASAWLFNQNGGGIAYFGEMQICENDKGHDLEIAMFTVLGEHPRTLGDVWLKAQQKYWYDNQSNGENFRPPRIYLGIMTFFGDPSLRMPATHFSTPHLGVLQSEIKS